MQPCNCYRACTANAERCSRECLACRQVKYMTDEVLDLKIARTGQEYSAVPVATIRLWIQQRRVTRDDLVRPVGARNWLKVSLAPELLQSAAGAVGPPASSEQPTPTGRTASSEQPVASGTAATSASPASLGILAPAKRRPPRRRRRLEDTVMDMTPMIDVTFQLLIFFMVTNQMAAATPLDVPEAVHGRGVSPDGMQSILVDDQSGYFLGDSLAEENRAESLDALVTEVASNAQAVDAPLDVIISAHRNSRHVEVRGLMERLGGIDNIGAIRLGVEEAP